MRRLPVPFLLLLALALVPPSRAASCDRPQSRTLRTWSEVRVYETGPREETRTYACLRRTGRTTFLGEEGFPAGGKPEGFRLAGHFLAYSRFWMTGEGDSTLRIVVADLSRSRVRRQWEFGAYQADRKLRVRGARLKPSGAFAFLVGPTDGEFQYDPPRPGPEEYSVHVADSRGRRELDSGPLVRAFRATDSRISWRNGSSRGSARFR